MMLLISRTSQGFSLREALPLLLSFIIIIKCVILLNVVWSPLDVFSCSSPEMFGEEV